MSRPPAAAPRAETSRQAARNHQPATGTSPIALVGDGIENPWNARTLLAAAQMFGTTCHFRDRAGLAAAWAAQAAAAPLPLLAADELASYAPLIACDNLPGADDVYGAARAPGLRPALVVGNERRGLARDVQALAGQRVQIPMFGRGPDCLNVAAAAAVVLYYLGRGGGGRLHRHTRPERRRPILLLVAPADHVELGSTIRSAGAFGWDRLLVDDRAGVWFGVARAARAEGRAAARRHRNPLHVLPTTASTPAAFDEVTVVTTRHAGIPLHRASLAGGPRQLLAIPDESAVNALQEDWERLGKRVRLIQLDLPAQAFPYHYRLVASIALAEAGRQIGQRARATGRPPARERVAYDSALAVLSAAAGEIVYLDELVDY
jgi:tRNA G18 (ribose-2'-O)-methylase SpoU